MDTHTTALRRLLRPVAHILREDGDLLERWRARLTAAFLVASATLALIPAVLTISMALREQMYILAAVDFVAISAVYVLLLSRRVSNRVRNIFLAGATFGIGVAGFLTLGPYSSALAWLMISLFLTTFLLGPRATALSVVAITILLVGIGVGIETERWAWAVDLPGGTERWVLIALDFFFLSVIFAGANAFVFQLVEREDAARARAEAQLAEGRRNEALGRLAGGIAHDFNNLLVPVMANVEAVREGLPPGSEEEQALKDAHRSAERARDLVRRILVFGRGLEVSRTPLDPVAVATDVMELARLGAPPGVRLRLDTSPSPPVHAAITELHQVVHNLVTNGLHAVAEGGTVRVTVAPERDGAGGTDDAAGNPTEGPRRVEIRVEDTGVGMDAATRERIFDPYFSTKAPGQGTGLGLPIVQSVVAALGGEISVQSSPGQGSSFVVFLPSADERAGEAGAVAAGEAAEGVVAAAGETGAATAAAAEAVATVAAPSGATQVASDSASSASPSPASGEPDASWPHRVLLVDDESGVRRAIQRMLESAGYAVDAVEGPHEALESLQAGSGAAHLLLSDYRMPGMTGTELVRAVRRLQPGLPVVLMSGHIEEAMRAVEGEPHEAPTLFLSKPFGRAELLEVVRTATRDDLEGRKAGGPA